VECNPVAANLLKDAPNRLIGRQMPSLFTPETWAEVRDMLGSTQLLAGGAAISARLAHDGSEVTLSASLFRNASSSLFLLRMNGPKTDAMPASGRESQTLSIIEGLPDGFVVIDSDRRILLANAAFVEMAQLAAETQVKGELVDRWLGRPGVDLNILLANLREHGSVRNFATIMRGEYGVSEQVEVSAVSAVDRGQPHVGLVVRLVTPRLNLEAEAASAFPRSVDQLTGLVGRVALKEIVRETVDLIERLCIEAALKVSGDNRASAAQILGLSRQSLYSKLHRHGFDDSGEEPPR
jgi:transcriptional regulator PpsR